MIIKSNLLALSLLLLCTTTISAQREWMQMADKTSNFYDIKAAFLKENDFLLKSYYQNLRKEDNEPRDETFQAEHEKEEYQDIIHYMRFADWVEPRVASTNGDMDALIERDYRARLEQKRALKVRSAANWTVVGPLSTNAMVGNGRVNSIKVDPNNATTLYACTPGGQLWKSTNNGTSWAVISDDIPAAGVTDVAIDPTNSQILYALTGDADRSIYHPYTRGVYKSTNGGATWAQTGLNYTTNGVTLTSIIVHPTSTNIVLVSGTNGIWRSTNGGATFTNVNGSSIRELHFNPLQPATVWAGAKTGAVLLRSYDAGATWTQLTNLANGVPTSALARRLSLDISPVDTNYVYLLATNTSDALQGFYRSTDAGTTFTLMSTSPNIPSSQGWYDLAVAADATTANTVYAAGLNVYKSTDGGVTWASTSIPHVDVHDLQFNGTDLLASSDGGVYRRTGSTWTNISSNLAIAQPYGIGLSPSNANMIISGHQDNGTNLTTNGTTWTAVSGGDGMIAFIDRTNNNNLYMTYQNGSLRRSTNGGASSSTVWQVPNGYWVTPYMQDPQVATTLYAGGYNLYKSTNSGTTWDSISNFGTTMQIRWIDVARTNNQIIYFINSANAIYKTTNGGTTWTNVTGTLPTGSTFMHVHIDVNNPNAVYLSIASTSGSSVYYTSNSGTTWTNISAGLPLSPANTVVTQIGAAGVAYCGTDIGVYYRDPSVSASWQPFLTGLPVVPIRDLEIHYATSKIRAGTFGRSIWESPLDKTVPVELLTFQGKLLPSAVGTSGNTEGVLLTWQTASEAQFNHFDIERSADSKFFDKIKDHTAKGTASSYQTIDEKPNYGINYYRLKMVDNDGSFTYSKTIAVEWNKPSKAWTLFPNPVKDKIYLSGNEDVSGEQTLDVIDIGGKLILKTTVQKARNGLIISDLPNGSYFMEMANERKAFVIDR